MKQTFLNAMVLTALAGFAATAQAADIRPGLWEFRSTRMSAAGMPDMSAQMAEMQKQMKNLPPETQRMLQQQMAARGVQLGKDGAVRSCITPEQARQDNIYTGKTDGGCTLASVTKAGNASSAGLRIVSDDAESSASQASRCASAPFRRSFNPPFQLSSPAWWPAIRYCNTLDSIKPSGPRAPRCRSAQTAPAAEWLLSLPAGSRPSIWASATSRI
jgi:hypothetical protein